MSRKTMSNEEICIHARNVLFPKKSKGHPCEYCHPLPCLCPENKYFSVFEEIHVVPQDKNGGINHLYLESI